VLILSEKVALVCDMKLSEILTTIEIGHAMWSWVSPDKIFAAIAHEKKLLFYHINGCYDYFEMEIPQCFDGNLLKLLDEPTYALHTYENNTISVLGFSA
jgi:hypothetical protein